MRFIYLGVYFFISACSYRYIDVAPAPYSHYWYKEGWSLKMTEDFLMTQCSEKIRTNTKEDRYRVESCMLKAGFRFLESDLHPLGGYRPIYIDHPCTQKDNWSKAYATDSPACQSLKK